MGGEGSEDATRWTEGEEEDADRIYGGTPAPEKGTRCIRNRDFVEILGHAWLSKISFFVAIPGVSRSQRPSSRNAAFYRAGREGSAARRRIRLEGKPSVEDREERKRRRAEKKIDIKRGNKRESRVRSCIATTNEPSWNGPPKSRGTWRRNAVTGKPAVAAAARAATMPPTSSSSSSPVDDFLLSSSSTTLPISLHRSYLRIHSGLVPRVRLIPLKRPRSPSNFLFEFPAWSEQWLNPLQHFLLSDLKFDQRGERRERKLANAVKQIYRWRSDEWEAEPGSPLLRAKLLGKEMVKSSIIRAPCNHVNLNVSSDWVYTGKEFVSDMIKPSNCSALKKNRI